MISEISSTTKSGDRLTIDITNPVSYTHLDVYKRQDYINPAIRPVFDKIAKKAWKEVTK